MKNDILLMKLVFPAVLNYENTGSLLLLSGLYVQVLVC